ncbi:MAG TPA: ATP-binding protein [Kofleriaceae bacterium]
MKPLSPSSLSAPCDPATLPFVSTVELEARDEIVGQAQALRALDLGLTVRADGYNLFVAGAPQTGKRSILRRLVRARAAAEPTSPDLCYVHNFDDPDRPLVLELPAGRSRPIRLELEHLVSDYARRLPLAFDGEAFAQRAAAITERTARERDRLLAEIEARLGSSGFKLETTGGALDVAVAAPDGSVMSEEAFAALPAAKRAEIDERGRALRSELEPFAARLRELERGAELEREQLATETASTIARAVTDEARARIGDAGARLASHLDAIQHDLVSEAASFAAVEPVGDGDHEDDESPAVRHARRVAERAALLARYVLHVIVDRTGETGAPVIEEANPTYANLFGRIERKATLGVLETSVAGLKAGALQRARGGYLLLDAAPLVDDAETWAALKRALHSGEVRIEEQGSEHLVVGSLQPEPSPLDTKLLLIGVPELYLALFEADEEFVDLFKVKVELDDTLERSPAHELALARFIAAAAHQLGVPGLQAGAVAALIDHASREAGHQRRLSARLGRLRDLVVEAGHYTRVAGRTEVVADDVARAVRERLDRSGLLERTLGRLVDDGTLVARSEGTAVGAANALSVISDGERAFGQVQRVTARARAGRPGIVDIERQIGLAGAHHAKGVLMLSGFLAGRFVLDRTLALQASIAAEQTHGVIEGDSASLAELCALLSAIGGVPLRQDLAVTGAVSQLGEVLAVGEVTLKVEGFFDLCKRRGLTGSQGAIIPRANVQHLMVRAEVVDAARGGQFAIYAVDDVDQALALLGGRDAGARGADGRFPAGSINAAIEDVLDRWAPAAKP